MKKTQIFDLLCKISEVSVMKSSKYGVHYYEHDKNGHYRPCPEAFIVDSVYQSLVESGWRITAEAHQGGIWGLFGKEDQLPKGAYKNRYDLAIWEESNQPVALCEFKWGFNQAGFRKDAGNVYLAGKTLGILPILCLISVKPSKADLKAHINTEIEFLKDQYGVSAEMKSKVSKAPRFFCGSHYDNEYSYTQAASICLNK